MVLSLSDLSSLLVSLIPFPQSLYEIIKMQTFALNTFLLSSLLCFSVLVMTVKTVTATILSQYPHVPNFFSHSKTEWDYVYAPAPPFHYNSSLLKMFGICPCPRILPVSGPSSSMVIKDGPLAHKRRARLMQFNAENTCGYEWHVPRWGFSFPQLHPSRCLLILFGVWVFFLSFFFALLFVDNPVRKESIIP